MRSVICSLLKLLLGYIQTIRTFAGTRSKVAPFAQFQPAGARFGRRPRCFTTAGIYCMQLEQNRKSRSRPTGDEHASFWARTGRLMMQ
jgi:hypothetical protein